MNATRLLVQQHEEVRELFEQLAAADDLAERRELFLELADELSAHILIEENLFYPAVYVGELGELLQHGAEEHLRAKRLLADLLDLDVDDGTFEAKLGALREDVERHLEEEERAIFPRVRRAFAREELEELGDEMATLHEELREGEPRKELPRHLEAPSLAP